MNRVYSLSDLQGERGPSVGCTAVIPAAGKGTRLGSTCPKALFKVAGRTLLEWVSSPLMPYCERFVYVAAPEAVDAIGEVAESILPGRCTVVIQPEAIGMGDAVLCAEPAVDTEDTLVTWIDQIAVAQATIAACFNLRRRAPHASLILPTVVKSEPYIQFMRRQDDMRIMEVRQKREGDEVDLAGENDCGTFLFQTDALFDSLRVSPSALVGRRTGELNLLPIIPRMESVGDGVLTVRVASESEAVGVNTPQDAEFLTEHLSSK